MGDEYDDVQVETAGEAGLVQPPSVAMAPLPATDADQARAIAEVQGAITVARAFPRDFERIRQAIRAMCRRPRFAAGAFYSYRRGGTLIEGLSVTAIRPFAACYQHVDYGMRELERRRGTVKMEAYAWDMYNNVRAVRQFIMGFRRDVGGGTKEVTGERDQYELAANFGMRRVRACLEQIIPPDLLVEASDLCNATIRDGDGKRPWTDRVSDMIVWFGEIGVGRDALDRWLGGQIAGITPPKFVELTRIYNAILAGETTPIEQFALSTPQTPPQSTEGPTAASSGADHGASDAHADTDTNADTDSDEKSNDSNDEQRSDTGSESDGKTEPIDENPSDSETEQHTDTDGDTDSGGFGAHLLRLRRSAGMTQAELEAAAELPTKLVSKLENGRSRPASAGEVTAIALALGADVDELLALAKLRAPATNLDPVTDNEEEDPLEQARARRAAKRRDNDDGDQGEIAF